MNLKKVWYSFFNVILTEFSTAFRYWPLLLRSIPEFSKKSTYNNKNMNTVAHVVQQKPRNALNHRMKLNFLCPETAELLHCFKMASARLFKFRRKRLYREFADAFKSTWKYFIYPECADTIPENAFRRCLGASTL